MNPHLIVCLLLLWRPDKMVQMLFHPPPPPQGQNHQLTYSKKDVLFVTSFQEYRCARYFFFPEGCMPENHSSKPSKCLGGRSLKCTVIYIGFVDLCRANLFFPVFPERLTNSLPKNVRRSRIGQHLFSYLSSVSVMKNDSLRSPSVIMTFPEWDENSPSNV